MSFLLDPPLLVATGAAIERLAPDERAARLAEGGALALFLGVSACLYLDRPGTALIWRAFGASSGRDFMLGSGLVSRSPRARRPALDLLAAAIFSTYPSWLRLGRRLASGPT
jgi:hypothetical protein